MKLGLNRRELTKLGALGLSCIAAPHMVWGDQKLKPGELVDPETMQAIEASWYKKLEGKRVECGLCPQKCTVADMERGMCGARENRAGTYYTLVHSRACSVHADPIEKKPFFHVLPGEKALSFATAGCNVECKFCQNWEISQFRPEQVTSYYLPPDALVDLAEKSGAKLTAATYSEPTIFWEYVRDSAIAAQKRKLKPTVVSNGYIEEKPLAEVLPYLSAFKVDLKAFTDEFYQKQVRGRLKPVLASLEAIKKSGVWLEIVVLLIPTLNDSEIEIRLLAQWVKSHLGSDVPVHFTRFHPTYRLKNLPPTPVKTLERAWAIAKEAELDFVYVGNLPGHPGENTVCPGCGEVLIRRVGFSVLENRLVAGACKKCQRKIPGVWA